MNDLAVSRRRMVAEQLRDAGIDDARVLDAMASVPRHRFVPKLLRHRAYHGCALPIGQGQTISQPFVVGLMTLLLELRGDEHVLEVGTGSGYQAAVLARLAASVVSVERIESLAVRAARTLHELGVDNVEVLADDGAAGVPQRGPYDAVVVTACARKLPSRLFHQLREGGAMVLPIGDGEDQVLYRYRKTAGAAQIERSLSCRFVPLLDGVVRREERA